jgi:hypothetical protein
MAEQKSAAFFVPASTLMKLSRYRGPQTTSADQALLGEEARPYIP